MLFFISVDFPSCSWQHAKPTHRACPGNGVPAVMFVNRLTWEEWRRFIGLLVFLISIHLCCGFCWTFVFICSKRASCSFYVFSFFSCWLQQACAESGNRVTTKEYLQKQCRVIAKRNINFTMLFVFMLAIFLVFTLSVLCCEGCVSILHAIYNTFTFFVYLWMFGVSPIVNVSRDCCESCMVMPACSRRIFYA